MTSDQIRAAIKIATQETTKFQLEHLLAVSELNEKVDKLIAIAEAMHNTKQPEKYEPPVEKPKEREVPKERLVTR